MKTYKISIKNVEKMQEIISKVKETLSTLDQQLTELCETDVDLELKEKEERK